MYMLVIAIVIAIVLVVAVLALAGGYRVLKAAHTQPTRSAGHPQADGSAHGGHSRSGGHSHGTLEKLVLKSVGGTIVRLVRLGVPVGPVMMLTVRGRKTGLPRTNPVDLFQQDGGYWLVATHRADASWVRNLRAAGEGTLARGRRRLEFTAAELPQDEAGAALMRIAGPRLAKPLGGLVLRQTIGLTADAPQADFVRAAVDHPVFRLSIRGARDLNAPGHTATSIN
jgi:deazaflavin-dependent oxidoreductase (nitroreductase family)